MRPLRSVLTFSAIALSLAACGADECAQPRTGDEETCETYDGGQLSFVLGDPLPELSAYCESRCVDVNAPISIAGYDDLRRVPFLSKVRLVKLLNLNMDTLRDLRGLENVDVTGNLILFGINRDTSRKTLEGLSDREVGGFTVEDVYGLSGLQALSLRRAESLSVIGTSIQQVDLRQIAASYVSALGNSELKSMLLPAGPMAQLVVHANSSLTELSWEPGLVVRDRIFFENNASLSTCLVHQFVEQTDAGTKRTELVRNNGPCP